MDNILVSLPSKVAPDALAEPTPHALKVGKTTLAMTLFEMFVQEDTADTKVARILGYADSTTHVEFATACKDAQGKADIVDAASGFKAEEGAKGTDKYGPSRRVLNQRLSEAKQIFGVAKLQPTLLAEKGYWSALDAARTYLDEMGLKWNNSPVLSADDREAKRNGKLQKEALSEVMDMYEQRAGENIREYMERMASKVDAAIEAKQAEKESERVTKLVTALVEKHGTDMLVNTAVAAIEQYGDLAAIIGYLSDVLASQEQAMEIPNMEGNDNGE